MLNRYPDRLNPATVLWLSATGLLGNESRPPPPCPRPVRSLVALRRAHAGARSRNAFAPPRLPRNNSVIEETDAVEYCGSPVGDARCTVLLGLSFPTYVRDSRHVTEPSEWVGPRPSAIGYVAKGWIAAF
jgi:hypothetical protein